MLQFVVRVQRGALVAFKLLDMVQQCAAAPANKEELVRTDLDFGP
jgi:hypothetical protein